MSLKFVRELAQMRKNVSWPVFCTKSVVIFVNGNKIEINIFSDNNKKNYV